MAWLRSSSRKRDFFQGHWYYPNFVSLYSLQSSLWGGRKLAKQSLGLHFEWNWECRGIASWDFLNPVAPVTENNCFCHSHLNNLNYSFVRRPMGNSDKRLILPQSHSYVWFVLKFYWMDFESFYHIYTLRKKSTSKHLFWCLSLSQIGHWCQHQEGPISTWKDHFWIIEVLMVI